MGIERTELRVISKMRLERGLERRNNLLLELKVVYSCFHLNGANVHNDPILD